MYFSEIVNEIGSGNWKLNEKDSLIYEIVCVPLHISFYLNKTTIKITGKEEESEIQLTDFSNFSFKSVEKKDESGEKVLYTSLIYNKTVLYEAKDERMASLKELINKLSEHFTDNETCSPKYQVESLIDEYDLNESPAFNFNLYKLLLIYKTRLDVAVNNDFLKPKSKILVFLEEGSGKVVGNLGSTAKKSFGRLLSGGLSGVISVGVDIAKAAGSRVVKSFASDFVGAKNFILLTDKNVIISKNEETNEYDFDDAFEMFTAKEDDTLAGVVDIYDDCNNLILDNVAQTGWNLFRNQLRKIRKEAEHNLLENSSSNEETDEFEIATQKITKLKKMLDAGLISQEDFDSKKAEILSNI